MRYTVYTITDNLQGRTVYVGKTQDFERRKKEHLTLSTHTKDWILALGVENITIEPIAEFGTKEEALEYEDKIIVKYNTIEDGFNKNRSGFISSTDIKQYQKQYEKTNKEKRREINKKYFSTHSKEIKDYQREYHKQYQQEHKEQLLEYHKQYDQKHKEQRREYQRQYYQKKKAQKQMQLNISNTPNGHLIQLTIPF